MSVPSGLDFSNVRHVRVWHEQFEAIKNKGEFLIVEDVYRLQEIMMRNANRVNHI